MNFRIAISKSHLSKLVVAFVSILLFEFLIRDYAILLMSNVRTEGSFAPASPHKASTGSDLGISLDQSVKVIDASNFQSLILTASQHPRKRKMTDLTKDPEKNSMQVLLNTWTEGSYSPVHDHPSYSESFVVLDGDLAFFVFNDKGDPVCHVLSNSNSDATKRAIVVEAGQWHAMTAAPKSLGYQGHAVILEVSGHFFSSNSKTKRLAPFAPIVNEGLDGEPKYFEETLLPLCASIKAL